MYVGYMSYMSYVSHMSIFMNHLKSRETINMKILRENT